jgi:hypothetical protein
MRDFKSLTMCIEGSASEEVLAKVENCGSKTELPIFLRAAYGKYDVGHDADFI